MHNVIELQIIKSYEGVIEQCYRAIDISKKSKKQIAEELDISRAYLYKLKNGDASPHVELVKKMVQVLLING